MRHSLFAAVSGLVLLGAASARADLSIAAVVRDHKLSATEAAAAILIADALKLDATFVIGTGRSTGASLIALGPAFVLSRETRRPVGDIWKSRKRGRGWGVIAKDLGMHPGTFNKLRRNGDFDRSAWVVLCDRRYGFGDRDFSGLERQGLGRGDVLVATVLSGGSRDKLKVVVSDFKKDKGWKVGKPSHAGGGKSKALGKSSGGSGGNKGKGKGKT